MKTISIEVTKKDIMEAYPIQPMLNVLKEKGAPITGIIHLTPDFENYSWETYQSYNTETQQQVHVFNITKNLNFKGGLNDNNDK